MADVELDSLELQITSDAKSAQAGLDALIGTLETLKQKTKGGVGLTAVANQVKRVSDAASKMNGSEGAKLESLAKGLQALSGLGNLKLSSSVANQISAIGGAVKNLDGVDFGKVSGLAAALAPLETLGKSNLGSISNQIKKLPEVMTELNKLDMNAFAAKIKELTVALKPLADEMQKVANGFSAFPGRIQQFLTSSEKVPSSNAKSALSFANLAAKVTAFVYTIKRAARVVASWINESNKYTENLNLFTVSVGQYATAAMEYANKVSEAMGIDTSEWIRNQGVFMTLATGFGVVGDRAATMSHQLTQLGYDLSSYYNIAVEEAMQKLKSGFAGELEPLRNLGYDLSQAKLEAIALSLGIDKSVSSMTQAEKAQLRYYAIMTQVTQVQGDMARTLEAPSNQLRVFQAQLQMAARSLGNIFIPALNAILPYAIAAVKVIRYLADAIAGLFGFTFPEMDVSNLGSSAGVASDAIEEATGNAKKLKKTLLGIDELNVMPDTSGSGAGAGASGGGFDFEIPTYDFIGEAANSRVNQIVEEMKEWLGITGEITSWSDLLDTRLGSILSTVGLIGASLLTWKLAKGFIDGVSAMKKLLASPSHSIAIGAVLTITGFTLAFTGMEDAVERGLDGFNFAEILSGGLLGTGGAAILGSTLATWIDTAFAGSAIDLAITQAGINLGVGTAGAAGAAILGSFAAVIVGIPAFFVGIHDAIMDGIDWLNSILIGAGATAAGAGIGAIIGMLGGPIGAGIGALIGLAVGLVTDLTILIVQNWEAVTAWCSDACAAIGQFFSGLWNGIVSVWNTVSTWFGTNVIQPVVGFFRGLWTSVSGFFVNLWADIVAIFITVSGWFNTNVILPVGNFFRGLWTGISTAASTCWNAIVAFFSPAIQWFSSLFTSVWQTLSDIFYNIGVIASGCWEVIKAVWSVVCTWFDVNVVQPVSNFFTQLWSAISTAAINAWTGIQAVFATISSWINQYIILPVGTFFTNLWAGIKTTAVAAWNGIKSVYATVTTWISTNIIQPVGTFFTNLWNGFINGAKTAWAGVKSVFSTVVSFFETTFKKAWAGVVKVFSTAGQIFVNIKDGIVTAFKSIVNGIIGGLNRVVSVPFNGINNALTKIKNISIMGLTPFSDLRTISVPSIPYLAQGGVVTAGQLFVANEAGPELVANAGSKTAVMNNDQIVESVSQGVYRAVVQAMGSSRGDQVVEAKVNDKVLFEVLVSRARQETVRTGHNPLLGGA